MFDYIQKFKKLPADVYAKLSGPEAASIIDSLEKEYSISLAKLVMLAAVKEIPVDKLENYIPGEFGLTPEKSKKLSDDLRGKLFSLVKSYFYPQTKVTLRPEVRERKEETKNESGGPGQGAIKKATVQNFTAEIPEPVRREAPKALEVRKESLPSPVIRPAATAVRETRNLKSAPFFFSAEDEEEISSLSNKALSYLGDNRAQSDIEETLDSVIREFGNNFASAEAVSRLKQILKTYLQGIRDKLETKSTLMKDYRSGGMGVDEKFALSVLSAIERGGAGRESAPEKDMDQKPDFRPVWKPITVPAARDMDYDLKSEIEKRKKEISKIVDKDEPPREALTPEKENKVKEELSKALKAAVGKSRFVPPSGIADDKKITEEKLRFAEASRDKPAVGKLEIASAPVRLGGNGRKKMEDVKFTPKILTPVEELKYLDLNNFRRLYKDSPVEAAKKILEKISLLEEEEYAKRLAGINAWRQSPLIRLYLETGSEAIAARQSVIDIIAKRKAEKKDFLTEDEIHAIMDLNRELRF
ncbi:MAG: hypothetical protein WC745_04570 [Patescibacteria group bacterium]|jgi:hypothetical protein